eukprot:14872193-Alexandrium_andersonii.AAC.1
MPFVPKLRRQNANAFRNANSMCCENNPPGQGMLQGSSCAGIEHTGRIGLRSCIVPRLVAIVHPSKSQVSKSLVPRRASL